MSITSLNFSMTVAAVLERARYLCVSEDFVGAIEFLKVSLDKEFSNEEMVSLLVGETDLDEQLNIVPGTDEEHKQLVSEVLENYDFLYPLGEGKYLHAVDIYEYEAWNKENDFEAFLLANEGEVLLLKDIDVRIRHIMDRASHSGGMMNQIIFAEAFAYKNGRVLVFEKYNHPFYDEFSKSYQDLGVLMDMVEAAHQ